MKGENESIDPDIEYLKSLDYVGMRVGKVVNRARQNRFRAQALIRRREKAMSAGRWAVDSEQTAKLVKVEIDLLREAEETERETLEIRDLYEKKTGRKIEIPPGHRLIEISRRFLSAPTYNRYVYPHIADMHSEYFPALQVGDLRKAKIIEIAFYFRVLWPIIKAVCSSFKTLIEFAGK